MQFASVLKGRGIEVLCGECEIQLSRPVNHQGSLSTRRNLQIRIIPQQSQLIAELLFVGTHMFEYKKLRPNEPRQRNASSVVQISHRLGTEVVDHPGKSLVGDSCSFGENHEVVQLGLAEVSITVAVHAVEDLCVGAVHVVGEVHHNSSLVFDHQFQGIVACKLSHLLGVVLDKSLQLAACRYGHHKICARGQVDFA